MFTQLSIYGLLLTIMLTIYNRWLCPETLTSICSFILIIELFFSFYSLNYIHITNIKLVLFLGSINLTSLINFKILFMFDYITYIFFAILSVALVACFVFLIEYFIFDSGAINIVLLSVVFAQFALWFFASVDLISLISLWEGISFISFFLIQHWAHRIQTIKAGLKVFVISQIGDCFFFIFLFLTINIFETTDLNEISVLCIIEAYSFFIFSKLHINVLNLLGVFAITATLLKAAQFLFYPWLLDAMEAPVPISAQLHSSTLVIIGFYVYLRLLFIMDLSIFAKYICLLFGPLTIIGASVLGFYQADGKRLLACSTASQLGYVVTALGCHLYEEAVLLLAFCCCNKAITFIWFGIFMQTKSGLSDFRFISGSGVDSWITRSGLIVAISNFTIAPGAFSWHIKATLIQGTSTISIFELFALDLLQLTWFFSSLYLLTLIFTLNFGARSNETSLKSFMLSFFIYKKWNLNFLVLTLFCVMLTLIPTPLLWSISISDPSWLSN